MVGWVVLRGGRIKGQGGHVLGLRAGHAQGAPDRAQENRGDDGEGDDRAERRIVFEYESFKHVWVGGERLLRVCGVCHAVAAGASRCANLPAGTRGLVAGGGGHGARGELLGLAELLQVGDQRYDLLLGGDVGTGFA